MLGISCGECAPHYYCIANRCDQDPAYGSCEGDLQATPAEIAVEATSGQAPAARGGTINDGIYDLVAQREYVALSSAAKYLRGAMRFTDGATRVEHINDPVPRSQADEGSPHRLMTVSTNDYWLNFSVTCPPNMFRPSYARRFTVEGAELWLFQDDLIEIYERRP